MARNPTQQELEMIKQAEQKARLVAKNKEAARGHLLAIQLLLSKRVSSVK
jgi:hypothetical protein